MIIDAHGHLGLENEGRDRRKGCTQWHKWLLDNVPDMTSENISLESLLARMDSAGVDKMCTCGLSFDTIGPYDVWGVDVGNDYVARCVDKYPDRFVGVAGINPLRKDAVDEMVRCVTDFGFKGIKMWPPAGFYPTDKEHLYPIYEKAVELGIVVSIHMGASVLPGTRVKYTQPYLIDDVAKDFPELKIHINHFGFPMETREMAVVATVNRNVCVDISLSFASSFSGFPYYFDMDMLRYAEFQFPDRVLYATDYVGKYQDHLVPVIKSLPLSSEFREKLLGKNAARIYRIN